MLQLIYITINLNKKQKIFHPFSLAGINCIFSKNASKQSIKIWNYVHLRPFPPKLLLQANLSFTFKTHQTKFDIFTWNLHSLVFPTDITKEKLVLISLNCKNSFMTSGRNNFVQGWKTQVICYQTLLLFQNMILH